MCEIPPGKELAPQRQLFEEMIYILDGRGSTTVWNDAGVKITFEWKAGAIFAIPLNTWHQHFNASGKDAARFVSVTNAPAIINAFGDLDFVFNTKYDFEDRFNGEPDYFANKGEQNGLLLDTNFVADAINLPLIAAKERGAGGGHIRFSMAKGSMNSHISQFPGGHLQEGPRPRSRRLRDRHERRGLQPHVAGGRGAEALRVARGHAHRPAQHVVPPALQHRHHAGALPRLQVRKGSRSATRRACPRRGSASAWAATRSTTPTSRRRCARCSPTRSPSTASSRAWTEAYKAELAELPPKVSQAACLES